MTALSHRLTIEFLSDWHVGDGAGAQGYIDRIIRRDPRDGLPFVPAKTLTGILRDGCERVAQALEAAGNPGWQRFAAALFGGESRGSEAGRTTTAWVGIGPARLPARLRAALARPENRALADALTFLRPGIRLDDNGTAAHDMLRIEEVAVAGAVLEAAITFDEAFPAGTLAAACALLAAGAAAVERIGSKRRRGHGRCVVRIEGLDIRRDILFGPAPELAGAEGPRHGLAAHAPAEPPGPPVRHRLALEVEEALQIPAGSMGNLIRGRDHVPGGLLLAALDSWLREALGEHAPKLTAWLAQGAVQLRAAYPRVGDTRGLPTPMCLEQGKEDKHDVRSLLAGRANDETQRKPLREGYVLPGGLPARQGEPGPVRTPMQTATHATIEDASQRPTAAVGGVFTYEAILAGTVLEAELLLAPGIADLVDPAGLDGLRLRLGRSKKDDYGAVRVRHAGRTVDEAPPAEPGSTVTLWLTAPAILRDESLEPVTDEDGFARALSRELGLSGVRCTQAFYRIVRDDGWHVPWKEPRPTRWAFAPGSVFVLEGAWTREALARLAYGIGERRGEGFGEVRLAPSWLTAGQLPIVELCGGEVAVRGPLEPVEPTDFTRLLHRRAWLGLAARAAAVGFDELRRQLRWTPATPPNSQLGALRAQWLDFDEERMTRWLNHLAETANRAAKWPQGAIDRLREWVGSPARVWEAVEQVFGPLPCLPGHDREALKKDLAAEALRTFWLTVIGVELDRREPEAAPQAALEA